MHPQNEPDKPQQKPLRARCIYSRPVFGRALVRQALSADRCLKQFSRIGRRLSLLPPKVLSSSSSSSSPSSPSPPSSSPPWRMRRGLCGMRAIGHSLIRSITPSSHSGAHPYSWIKLNFKFSSSSAPLGLGTWCQTEMWIVFEVRSSGESTSPVSLCGSSWAWATSGALWRS